ncbi:hypothetical protein N9074_01385 [Akkermansiaceae bacterium]|nr:hypothetical protein [Akkermansiaceae bacterium]
MAIQDEDFQKRLNEALGMFGQAPADIPVQAVDPVRAERLAFEASQAAPVAPVNRFAAPVVPEQPAPGSRDALLAQQEQLRQNAIAQQEAYKKSTEAITQRPRQRFLNEGQSFMDAFKNPGAGHRQFALNAGLSLLSSGGTQDLSQRLGHALGAGVQGMQQARQGELDVASRLAQAEQAKLGLEEKGLTREVGFTKTLMDLDASTAAAATAATKAEADLVRQTALQDRQVTTFTQAQNTIKPTTKVVFGPNGVNEEVYTDANGNFVTANRIPLSDEQISRMGQRPSTTAGFQITTNKDGETVITQGGPVKGQPGNLGTAKPAGLETVDFMKNAQDDATALTSIADIILSPGFESIQGSVQGLAYGSDFIAGFAPNEQRLLNSQLTKLDNLIAIKNSDFMKPMSDKDWPIIQQIFQTDRRLDQAETIDVMVAQKIPAAAEAIERGWNAENVKLQSRGLPGMTGPQARMGFASSVMVPFMQRAVLPLQADPTSASMRKAINTFPKPDSSLIGQGFFYSAKLNRVIPKEAIEALALSVNDALREQKGMPVEFGYDDAINMFQIEEY